MRSKKENGKFPNTPSSPQAPKMFIFVQNEEYPKNLIETWLNNHIRISKSIFSPNES